MSQHTNVFTSRRALDERTVWYMGHLFTFLATGEESDGQFALIEATIRQGLEPPPHTHEREDELYYILEGTIRFVVGDAVVTATPGMAVLLPRGVPHGFQLQAPEARALILCTPAGLERYFQEFSEPAGALSLPPPSARPPDIPRLIAAGERYGVVFLPPPAA
ncbi:MAG: quercetin 2,3-dioxygenase [Chloroflexaceae bacterium]